MRQHRLRRLRWACKFQHWQYRNWHHVPFSDESRFWLFRADGRTRIYRRAWERTPLCCVQEIVPFGGGSVMVWGGICGQQRTHLIVTDGNLTAHRYINRVSSPVLLPFLHHQPRPHTAHVVQQFFAANINVLPWPDHSHDLSLIEHLWDHFGQLIWHHPYPPMNRDQLVQALRQEMTDPCQVDI